MVNWMRGEIESDLLGRPMVFCLTLGALADIESRLGAADLSALLARLAKGKLSAGDVIAILGAAARGGGSELSNDALAALPLDGGIDRVCALAADLVSACFDDHELQQSEI